MTTSKFKIGDRVKVFPGDEDRWEYMFIRGRDYPSAGTRWECVQLWGGEIGVYDESDMELVDPATVVSPAVIYAWRELRRTLQRERLRWESDLWSTSQVGKAEELLERMSCEIAAIGPAESLVGK